MHAPIVHCNIMALVSNSSPLIPVCEPAHRHPLPRFRPPIRLVLHPAHAGPLRRAVRALDALRGAVNGQPTGAVHLHGFPVFLAKAMAAGLACVAELIDSPSERHRLRSAARSEARRRFGAQKFRDSMRDVYGPSTSSIV